MKLVSELDLTEVESKEIQNLRNESFPYHQVPRSYYKQRPHYRYLEYKGDLLVGYMGLDYRAVGVETTNYNVLGIIDICVKEEHRGKGLGSAMLENIYEYSQGKRVDFIILISDLHKFYLKNGYQKKAGYHSWLRLNEFKSYGVAHELLDDFYVRPVSDKVWGEGHIDWLGYMF